MNVLGPWMPLFKRLAAVVAIVNNKFLSAVLKLSGGHLPIHELCVVSSPTSRECGRERTDNLQTIGLGHIVG